MGSYSSLLLYWLWLFTEVKEVFTNSKKVEDIVIRILSVSCKRFLDDNAFKDNQWIANLSDSHSFHWATNYIKASSFQRLPNCSYRWGTEIIWWSNILGLNLVFVMKLMRQQLSWGKLNQIHKHSQQHLIRVNLLRVI